MANKSSEERYMLPIENLKEYILNKSIRDSAGWINGTHYHVNGRYFTPEQFEALFPVRLVYSVIQLDGNQIKVN